MRNLGLGAASLVILGSILPAMAEVVPRLASADGSVVARRSGEEVRFIDISDWRHVDVNQDLLAGDTLRTNALGNLAIRFADNTLVRMGRETTLLVRKIDGSSSSELDLQGGTIWGRADRGGSGLTIDTPAAAAAIRGTDWTLRTDGNRTTLTVLEGTVELSNGQGTVTVGQGEGAVATIGEAPRKYVLVELEEREQILLYKEIRGVFTGLALTERSGPQQRATYRRIIEIAPAKRTQEDWLSLAETAFANDGRPAAKEALLQLRRPLPAGQEARARLVEAMIAGQELRYEEASRLFSQALPGLSGESRTTAIYSRWFADALADPKNDTSPPGLSGKAGTASEAMARASIVSHLQGQREAIELLAAAENQFPDDARLPAMRASLAYELDLRDDVRAALERARTIDPDEPSYLLMNARFRATVSSDLDGALADLMRAVEIAPGADDVWNEIGIVQSDRNAIVEADSAHRKAIALNPENAALHANHARFLMDNDQLGAARAAIDAAEALDPASYAVLAAKGRYLLRMGRTAEGERALLDASAQNPTYGDALIGLAIASYQNGASGEAAQALDNADRFDRDNPSISLMRAGIALDQYRADDAIREAREALRRRQARGGYYTGYDANRQASSYLGVTLDNLGLEEWGQFYADKSYDPFVATTYFDDQGGGDSSPFVSIPPSGLDRYASGASGFALGLQGILLDPLAVANQNRGNSLERRNFFEATLGGGLGSEGGGTGWNGDLQFQGTNYGAMPLSYNLQASISKPEGDRAHDASDAESAMFEFGLRPTLTDNIYIFGSQNANKTGYPGQIWFPDIVGNTTSDYDSLGAAWSHTIAERNVVQAFAMVEHTNTNRLVFLEDSTGPYSVEETSDQDTISFGASHLFGIGPVTIRYGAEAIRYDSWNIATETDLLTGFVNTFDYPVDGNVERVYADATLDISNDFRLQAGGYYGWFESNGGAFETFDPRVGIAWAPSDKHWLRAYYREDTQYPVTQTLSPVSIVGLRPVQLPMFIQGQTKTAAVRWDAEWNERFFTAAEYQHVRFVDMSLDVPDFIGSFSTWQGEIDRIHLSANYWVGGGLGAFASLTLSESRDTSPFTGGGNGVPLVPDYVGQLGLTYVHPSRVTFRVAQTFVGERVGAQDIDITGTPFVIDLQPYSTTDASVTWKSESGHLELALQVLNIFDNDIEMALGIPAPGRSFLATMKARF
jgi:Tfp pilus assembly protein PilF